MKSLPLILVVALVGHCAGECPASHEELPTLWDEDTFNCAVIWQGEGDDSVLNSCIDCNGNDGIDEGLVYYDGYDYPGSTSHYSLKGSFLVKPGCTLTAWYEADYEGDYREFDGTLLEPNNDWGSYWGPSPWGCALYAWGSWKCRCQQKMLDCVPEDGYSTILVCDNTDSIVEVTCTYALTVGTTWSESTSESFSIDAGIEAAMSAGFWNLFSAELGVSASTGYDWTHASDVTTSTSKTFTVEATAPAGFILTIEQAIGSCGGEQPNTEMFKTSTFNKTGHLVSVKQEMVDVANDLDHWMVSPLSKEPAAETANDLVSVEYEHRGGRTTRESPRSRLEKAKGDPNALWRRNRNQTEPKSFRTVP